MAEKRPGLVRRIKELQPEASNRAIAEAIGVAPATVDRDVHAASYEATLGDEPQDMRDDHDPSASDEPPPPETAIPPEDEVLPGNNLPLEPPAALSGDQLNALTPDLARRLALDRPETPSDLPQDQRSHRGRYLYPLIGGRGASGRARTEWVDHGTYGRERAMRPNTFHPIEGKSIVASLWASPFHIPCTTNFLDL